MPSRGLEAFLIAFQPAFWRLLFLPALRAEFGLGEHSAAARAADFCWGLAFRSLHLSERRDPKQNVPPVLTMLTLAIVRMPERILVSHFIFLPCMASWKASLARFPAFLIVLLLRGQLGSNCFNPNCPPRNDLSKNQKYLSPLRQRLALFKSLF